jgi:hypothetical protein
MRLTVLATMEMEIIGMSHGHFSANGLEESQIYQICEPTKSWLTSDTDTG